MLVSNVVVELHCPGRMAAEMASLATGWKEPVVEADAPVEEAGDGDLAAAGAGDPAIEEAEGDAPAVPEEAGDGRMNNGTVYGNNTQDHSCRGVACLYVLVLLSGLQLFHVPVFLADALCTCGP